MPPTLADRVSHILETIDEVERALAGKSLEEFKSEEARARCAVAKDD